MERIWPRALASVWMTSGHAISAMRPSASASCLVASTRSANAFRLRIPSPFSRSVPEVFYCSIFPAVNSHKRTYALTRPHLRSPFRCFEHASPHTQSRHCTRSNAALIRARRHASWSHPPTR